MADNGVEVDIRSEPKKENKDRLGVDSTRNGLAIICCAQQTGMHILGCGSTTYSVGTA
jgi:hypothetical protein